MGSADVPNLDDGPLYAAPVSTGLLSCRPNSEPPGCTAAHRLAVDNARPGRLNELAVFAFCAEITRLARPFVAAVAARECDRADDAVAIDHAAPHVEIESAVGRVPRCRERSFQIGMRNGTPSRSGPPLAVALRPGRTRADHRQPDDDTRHQHHVPIHTPSDNRHRSFAWSHTLACAWNRDGLCEGPCYTSRPSRRRSFFVSIVIGNAISSSVTKRSQRDHRIVTTGRGREQTSPNEGWTSG